MITTINEFKKHLNENIDNYKTYLNPSAILYHGGAIKKNQKIDFNLGTFNKDIFFTTLHKEYASDFAFDNSGQIHKIGIKNGKLLDINKLVRDKNNFFNILLQNLNDFIIVNNNNIWLAIIDNKKFNENIHINEYNDFDPDTSYLWIDNLQWINISDVLNNINKFGGIEQIEQNLAECKAITNLAKKYKFIGIKNGEYSVNLFDSANPIILENNQNSNPSYFNIDITESTYDEQSINVWNMLDYKNETFHNSNRALNTLITKLKTNEDLLNYFYTELTTKDNVIMGNYELSGSDIIDQMRYIK